MNKTKQILQTIAGAIELFKGIIFALYAIGGVAVVCLFAFETFSEISKPGLSIVYFLFALLIAICLIVIVVAWIRKSITLMRKPKQNKNGKFKGKSWFTFVVFEVLYAMFIIPSQARSFVRSLNDSLYVISIKEILMDILGAEYYYNSGNVLCFKNKLIQGLYYLYSNVVFSPILAYIGIIAIILLIVSLFFRHEKTAIDA
jgi:hypothetical protein